MDSAASGGTTEGKPAATEHDAAATTTTTTIGAAAAASGSGVNADLTTTTTTTTRSSSPTSSSAAPSRYESQKRRDWNTFLQYLKNHKPPLTLGRCSGAHVIEFLKYLDQFGKTKVHVSGCAFFGHPKPPAPCACPLKQAWGSLDALIGRLRAAYEENGGRPESNPFGARAVRIYLREVREGQAKARGVPYEKKKRKRPSLPPPPPPPQSASSAAAASANVEPTKEIEVGPSSSTPTGTAEAGPSSAAATPPASSSSSVVAASSSSV